MKQPLPWNVTGIPPEAREIARSAAMREGTTVGDWLTRRIIQESARPAPAPERREPAPPQPASLYERDEETRRDRDDLVVRLARSEAEADSAFRRIDESLRNMSRRLESSERSQNEAHRAMSTAASEINAATRDQAQAFAHLTQRIDLVERHSDTGALRDAVRGLHQGLSRLADQIAKTANESSGQIATLADNMETLAGKLVSARDDTGRLEHVVEERFGALGERLKHTDRLEQIVEERLNAFGERLKHTEQRMAADERLEQTVAAMEARMKASEEKIQDAIGRQLTSIEHNIGNVVKRLELAEQHNKAGDAIQETLQAIIQRLERAERRNDESAIHESLRDLSQRFDAAEKRSRDALNEIKTGLGDSTKRIDAIESVASAKAGPVPFEPAIAPPIFHDVPPMPAVGIANFDLPPFPDAPPFPGGRFTPPPSGVDMTPPPAAAIPDIFAPQPESSHNTAQDYLAQARRAAQAVSQPYPGATRPPLGDPSHMGGMGGVIDLEERKKSKLISKPVGIAVLVLMVLAAGLLLTRSFATRNEVSASAPANQLALNTAPATPSTPGLPNTSSPLTSGAVALPQDVFGSTAPDAASAPSATPVQTAQPAARKAPAAKPSPVSAAAPPNDTRVASVAPPKAPAPAAPSATAPKTATTAPATPAASGGPQDRLLARAKTGDAKAALVLGLRYADGDGTAVNDAEAVAWLQKAAQAGEAVAQYRLGTLYEKGRGVPMDTKQAATWYLEAAKRGNRKAMHNLAVAYANGAGAEKNFTEAARWFNAASDLGLADSQFNLAVLYERGLGVPVSLAEAYKWYSIAATEGDTESKARVDALATQLQPADKDSAEKTAKAFKAQPLNRESNDTPTLAQVAP